MILLNIISILLTLGSAPECDGFGVCLLEKKTETTLIECAKYENCIQADMDYIDHEIILAVTQNKIKDKAFIKYFTKENFELEKDYTLSDDIAESINCPKGTVLRRGKYPINEENGKIIVKIIVD